MIYNFLEVMSKYKGKVQKKKKKKKLVRKKYQKKEKREERYIQLINQVEIK